MELKNYQKNVLNNLSSYMNSLNERNDIVSGWRDYWIKQDVNIGFGGVPSYNNSIKNVPHICMKVPTGGGKTFLACASIKKIYDAMPHDKSKFVVWLVPTDSILTQTVRNLSDSKHPYRQKLDADFGGRVEVYTKEQLLNGQNFSPDTVREMLTVCILSFSSLRINSVLKDVRKVYQENSNLMRFAAYYDKKDILLSDTPDTALIQVIRQLEPVVIVDESHNASSDLSIEMLNNLNPSFILDLTATPRKESNIISYVDARELKKENMVKLPVIVYNRDNRHKVISDAVHLRGRLEAIAINEENNGGEYIRPIVLFQAQSKLKGKETENYEKIKQYLIESGIPEEEIGIKTSEIDTISGLDLLNRSCAIRYIITVNALKEGWDCPFAYILASLANKTSSIDVEQVLGRILRQPYAKRHDSSLLNTSYVLTCSNDFRVTLDKIVVGLNKAGFSRKDYRVGQTETTPDNTVQTTQLTVDSEELALGDQNDYSYDNFDDIDVDELREEISYSSDNPSSSVIEMMTQAQTQSEEYSNGIAESSENDFLEGEFGDMLRQYAIQEQYREEIKDTMIPQFFIESTPNLFDDGYALLEKENLSEGFSLIGQDSLINFELSTGEMYSVDVQELGEAVPKYKKTNIEEAGIIRSYLAQFPDDKKNSICINRICELISKNNTIPATEVKEYVDRCIKNMTQDQIDALETSFHSYAKKIEEKIKTLENAYREKKFYQWLDSGKIICRDNYMFPKVITPYDAIDSIPMSLYEAEKNDMNDFELDIIDAVTGMNNIEFWHRNIERKGFRINGFINHYPDFVIKTKKGNIIMVEAKGDHLDGENSRKKIELGREWQSRCPERLYRYFMVFKEKEFKERGAYTIDEFTSVMKEL